MPEQKSMPGNSVSRLLFSLSGTIFAVAMDNVIKIIPMPPVTSLPFLPEGVDGIAAVGGKVIPILTLLNADSDARELVLLKYEDEDYGVRADRALRIADESVIASLGVAAQIVDITELVACVRRNGPRTSGSLPLDVERDAN
ncbi:MAG: chemotaxis protein CheW [Methylovirgula sp.]|uniref:chemotaxis protein CheW n=1 Tax=Methylovirgula sp. TaxID=1978224 RepID=UPI003076813F